MGCAFLRPLSQPADYDMLVATAGESTIPHTTYSSYRNAICPANDSRTLGYHVDGPSSRTATRRRLYSKGESVTRIKRIRYPRLCSAMYRV